MEQLLKDDYLGRSSFNIDDTSDTVFGFYKGYHFYIIENSENQFVISCSVTRDGQGPDRDFLTEIKSFGNQSVNIVSAKAFKVTAMPKAGMTKQKRFKYIKEAIDDLADYFVAHGFVDACEQTGQTQGLEVYVIGGTPAILSPTVFEEIRASMEDQQLANGSDRKSSENIFAGIVGAFLGSLIGVAVIVGIGQLGYVAWISGFAMGICTVKGYELLAKRYSMVGAIISLIIVIGMTYFANELDWAVTLARTSELDIFTAFRLLPEVKADPSFPTDDYWINLGLTALISLVAAIPTIFSALNDSKNQYTARQLSLEDNDDDF